MFFVGNQQRLAAAWVSNTGNQNQASWWNPNVDAATLGQMLPDNKGHLVVLEPFVVNDQVRLAAVWVSNVGPDGQAWWWNPNVDPATLGGMLETNKGRLTTLRTYVLGGHRRYAGLFGGTDPRIALHQVRHIGDRALPFSSKPLPSVSRRGSHPSARETCTGARRGTVSERA